MSSTICWPVGMAPSGEMGPRKLGGGVLWTPAHRWLLGLVIWLHPIPSVYRMLATYEAPR